MKKQPKKDLNYYITLYTLEGHTTWRIHLSDHPDGFNKQKLNIKPKITNVKNLILDRLTGEIK